jgi:hypothetical protein
MQNRVAQEEGAVIRKIVEGGTIVLVISIF